MTDSVSPSAPLHFEASFPCDARFRDAVADCAARLAETLASASRTAPDAGPAMVRAFEDALQAQEGGEVTFHVRVPAGGGVATLAVARRGVAPVEQHFA